MSAKKPPKRGRKKNGEGKTTVTVSKEASKKDGDFVESVPGYDKDEENRLIEEKLTPIPEVQKVMTISVKIYQATKDEVLKNVKNVDGKSLVMEHEKHYYSVEGYAQCEKMGAK